VSPSLSLRFRAQMGGTPFDGHIRMVFDHS
jgi:hypothetical protein